MELIFNRRNTYRPNIDDFNKFMNDFAKPPEIEISVVLKETKEEDAVDEEEIKKQYALEYKWQALNKYIDKYISRIYAGKPELKNKVESEYLDKFDCQMLDALRDAGGNMLSGKSPLLKNVLNYFLDKVELDKLTTEDDRGKLKEANRQAFKQKSVPIIEDIKNRLDLSKIKSLSENTGTVSSDTIIFDRD